MMEDSLVDILLEVHGGLLGHVAPSLRAVTVDLNKKKNLCTIHFFYDGEITDELFELVGFSTVEMNISETYESNDDIMVRIDYPAKIPIQGRLVYLRKEPTPTTYNQKSAFLYKDSRTVLGAAVLLALIDALLGKVTPQLRGVVLDANEVSKQISFYFIYDGEISKENFALANAAIEEASVWFPEFNIKREILRVDFPQRRPALGIRCAYARCEDFL